MTAHPGALRAQGMGVSSSEGGRGEEAPTPKQLRYIRWLGKRLGMTEGELLDYANRFLSEENPTFRLRERGLQA